VNTIISIMDVELVCLSMRWQGGHDMDESGTMSGGKRAV